MSRRKEKIVNTQKNNRRAFVILLVTAAVAVILVVLLLLEQNGVFYRGQTNPEIQIIAPERADDVLRSEGIYQYGLLKDGTVMLISASPEEGEEISITVPETLGGYRVTAIGQSCFALLMDLKTLVIPEGVTYIGRGFLYGTVNITLYLPSSLSQIETLAFEGCSAPDEIRYAGTAEQWAAVRKGSGNSVLSRVVTS